ncbi:MAG: DUF1385 domain-containing protein, partial [Clostridia bacterium]|nr:DUF1385 domain-containing protein [Clostridia bacterium]
MIKEKKENLTEERTEKKSAAEKLVKKIFVCLISVVLIFTAVTGIITVAGRNANEKKALSYDNAGCKQPELDNYADGCWNIYTDEELKVLHLTDVHLGGGWMSIAKDAKALKIIKKIPVLRGVVSFIGSLLTGYKSLNKSLELSGMTEDMEPESKFEKWLDKHLGDKMTGAIMGVASVIGVAAAIFLFMYLPALLVSLISKVVNLGVFASAVEGAIKITIFVLYMFLVSRLKDIQRMF